MIDLYLIIAPKKNLVNIFFEKMWITLKNLNYRNQIFLFFIIVIKFFLKIFIQIQINKKLKKFFEFFYAVAWTAEAISNKCLCECEPPPALQHTPIISRSKKKRQSHLLGCCIVLQSTESRFVQAAFCDILCVEIASALTIL
jgi:hypothetical protein